jgi:hypothetical protein
MPDFTQLVREVKTRQFPQNAPILPENILERFNLFLPQLQLTEKKQHPLFAVFLTLNAKANANPPIMREQAEAAVDFEQIARDMIEKISDETHQSMLHDSAITKTELALGYSLQALRSQPANLVAYYKTVQEEIAKLSTEEARTLRGSFLAQLENVENSYLFRCLLAFSGSALAMDDLYKFEPDGAFKNTVLAPALVLVKPDDYANVLKALNAQYANHDFVKKHLATIVDTLQLAFTNTSLGDTTRDPLGTLFAKLLVSVAINCQAAQTHKAKAVFLMAQLFLCAAASYDILGQEPDTFLALGLQTLLQHQTLLGLYVQSQSTPALEQASTLPENSTLATRSPEMTYLIDVSRLDNYLAALGYIETMPCVLDTITQGGVTAEHVALVSALAIISQTHSVSDSSTVRARSFPLWDGANIPTLVSSLGALDSLLNFETESLALPAIPDASHSLVNATPRRAGFFDRLFHKNKPAVSKATPLDHDAPRAPTISEAIQAHVRNTLMVVRDEDGLALKALESASNTEGAAPAGP